MKHIDAYVLALCGFSLIFSVDSAIQGLILALGILVFSPLLVVLCGAVYRLGVERGYTIVLFLSTLFMGSYLHFVASFDESLVQNLMYRATASMAAGPFLALGFSPPSQAGRPSAERERLMVSQGVILALFITVFSIMRNILAQGAVDLRFAGWGSLVPLPGLGFNIPPRPAGFFLMALILWVLSFFEEAPRA